MTDDDLWMRDHNLSSAMSNNGIVISTPVDEILATIEGQNEGADWHWIVRLEGGDYAYITGGCDYTGWD